MKTFIFACLISSSVFAGSFKISSDLKNETRFIKVIEVGNLVSFKFCDSRSKRCETLGPKNSYTKSSLNKRKNIEYARMGAVGALDAGIAVVAALGGYQVGVVATANAELLPAVVKTMGIMGATMTMSEVIAWSTKTLNPLTYSKNAKVVSLASAGEDSSRRNIVEFRNQLEELLYKL